MNKMVSPGQVTAASNTVCRGYISARPVRGQHVPQRVQNLVVRDYAQRTGLFCKMSEVEYIMPGCYIMLNSVIAEMDHIDGLITYSLFLLPRRKERRLAIYDKVLKTGSTLHCALEGFSLSTEADIQRAEDIFAVDDISRSAADQTF